MAMADYTMASVARFAGREIGTSDWIEVAQDRIDAFAACTGDDQWIHVDVERARRESAFGSTIAHGYLTLSLIAPIVAQVGLVPPDAKAAVNYGLDKVRFLAPVKAGSRVRGRVAIDQAQPQNGGNILLKARCTIDIDGEERPAMIAEVLCLLLA